MESEEDENQNEYLKAIEKNRKEKEKFLLKNGISGSGSKVQEINNAIVSGRKQKPDVSGKISQVGISTSGSGRRFPKRKNSAKTRDDEVYDWSPDSVQKTESGYPEKSERKSSRLRERRPVKYTEEDTPYQDEFMCKMEICPGNNLIKGNYCSDHFQFAISAKKSTTIAAKNIPWSITLERT